MITPIVVKQFDDETGQLEAILIYRSSQDFSFRCWFEGEEMEPIIEDRGNGAQIEGYRNSHFSTQVPGLNYLNPKWLERFMVGMVKFPNRKTHNNPT